MGEKGQCEGKIHCVCCASFVRNLSESLENTVGSRMEMKDASKGSDGKIDEENLV